MGRPTRIFVSLAAFALLLGACGDGEDGGSATTAADETAAAGDPTRLRFYDWEANVIPNPNAPDADRATETPFARRDDAERVATNAAACGRDRCIVIVEEPLTDNPDTETDESANPARGYFVLRDRPALTGAEIVDPEIVDDPVLGELFLSFGFTPAGAKRFAVMTRSAAERGRASAPEGMDPTSAADFSDHFVIVLDDRILTRPIINFAENPNGIDGSHGASIGVAEEQAQELVTLLRSDNGE